MRTGWMWNINSSQMHHSLSVVAQSEFSSSDFKIIEHKEMEWNNNRRLAGKRLNDMNQLMNSVKKKTMHNTEGMSSVNKFCASENSEMSHQKRKLQCISSKPKAFFSLCSINIAKSLWVSIYSRTHNKESAGQREQSQSRVQSQLINAELCKYQKQKAHKNGEQSKTAHENMINWAYQAISWNEQRSLVYEIIIFLFCADAQQNESQFNVCSFFLLWLEHSNSH